MAYRWLRSLRPASHRRISILLALVVGAGLSASAAQAGTMATIYASPTGSGTACTSASPCSLTGAKTKIEGMNSAMTGDIIVQLAGGTYRLSSTLAFTGTDSATNGYSIIWQAAPGQTPVFTGGQQVTGWTEIDTTHNIWEASLPSGANTFDLWVNGTRANLSQGGRLPSTTTQSSTGFAVPNDALQSLSNPNGLELVLQGAGWIQNTCPVSSVTGNSSSTTLAMVEPCYDEGYDNQYAPAGEITSQQPDEPLLENEKEWISGPNQWAFNTSSGKIDYEAPSGVSMFSTDAEIGSTQTLVALNGTESSPVAGIEFSGVTFEGTTIGASSGFAGLQADIEYSSITCSQDWNPNTFVTPTGGASQDGSPFGSCAVPMPSAVEVHAGRQVCFQDDTFTELGTAAVSFDGGTQHSSIVGSSFSDVGGNGIQIGTVASPNQSDTNLIDSNDLVKGNLINNVADDYHGGVGVWAGYTANLTIEGNTIENVPYSGISTGWGWGSQDTLPSIDTNNRVEDNYVTNTNTDPLQFDGGGIYNLGPQPNGVMSGNYVLNPSGGRSHYGFYLDQGSTGWTVEDDVATGSGISWAFNNSYDHYDNCGTITFVNDYASPIGSAGSNGVNSGCQTTQTVTGLSTNVSNTTAQGIVDRAGQTFPYKTTASTQSTFAQSNGDFTIDAAGTDVWTTTDQYGAIIDPGASGTTSTTIVKVTSLANTSSWAKAGIMLRNSIAGAGSSLGYAVLAATPGNGVVLQWDDSSSGGLNTYQSTSSSITAPVWLKLVRAASTITGYYSTDGSTWTEVGSGTLTGVNSTEDVGLFASSHDTGVTGQATFSNFSTVTAPFATYSNAPSTLTEDADGNFTIDSAGADVWQGTDQYGAIYVPGGAGAGNSTTVEVTTQEDSGEWVKAGIMLRNSIPGAGSSLGYCALAVTPEHGVNLMSDTNSDGGLDTDVGQSGLSGPIWLRLVRGSGNSVTGYYSIDGTNWTSVGTATCSGANATEDVGLFSTAYSTTQAGHVVFSNFSSTNSPYKTFSNTQATLVNDANGNFTIDSAGIDVWGGTDQYAAIYDPGAADTSSTTTVEVTNQADSGGWVKAGIMLRNSIPGAGSSLGYCALVVVPEHGIDLMSDTNSDGGLDTGVGPNGLSAPIWLRLVRTGSTSVTGYYSTNGTGWTSVGTATCSGANSTEDVGLFSTSSAAGVSGHVSFSNFSVTG
jgi:hypothetical protein